ncbi:alcohol dehydrogenase catalytic domain-containing protein [Microbacterium awajiense]|uniref:Alcohol dehydrogenase catalytic domain-containing protein n=1 Tax=Microbacterium awajiense TaxID=415214 RepID=A0ABP7ATT4_9MICO
MKTLTYRGPWEMSVRDRSAPQPRDHETLIDVIATGICGSDLHGYTGETDRRVAGQVMGHEMVGRVRSGGDLGVGTLVTVNPIVSCGECELCGAGETQACDQSRVIGVDPALPGSLADLLVAPTTNVVPLDGDLPVHHGTLVEPLAVGYHALMQGHPVVEDRLLIVGGGPIGQTVALAARRRGLTRILVSEPTAARRDLIEALGFSTTSPEHVADDVARVLGGRATLVVDAVGIAESLATALAHSTVRSRIVLVGMGAPAMTITPYEITVAERTVIGSYCYSTKHFRETAEWVAGGRPELDLFIDHMTLLDDGAEAFRAAAEDGTRNKTLVLSAHAHREDITMNGEKR